MHAAIAFVNRNKGSSPTRGVKQSVACDLPSSIGHASERQQVYFTLPMSQSRFESFDWSRALLQSPGRHGRTYNQRRTSRESLKHLGIESTDAL